MPAPIGMGRLYDYRDSGRITELLARQGEIAAQGALRSGETWGRVAEQLGQIGGRAVQEYGERKEQSKRDAALMQFVQSGAWQDPKAALAGSIKILGPREGPRFAEGLIGAAKMHGAQNPDDARAALPMVSRGLLAAPESMRPGLYGQARQLMLSAGIASAESMPEQWTPELLPYVHALAGQGGGAHGQATTERVKQNGVWYERGADGAWKQAAGLPAETPAPADLSFEEQMADALKANDMNAYNRLLRVKRDAGAAGRAPEKPPAPAEYTFNPEGVVLTSYPQSQRNEVRRQAAERGIPVFEGVTTQAKGAVLAGIVQDAQELDSLLRDEKVRAAIGPIAGRWTQAKGKLWDLDPTVQRAVQLMTSLSDTELRKRSGAQINEAEMQRILRFATDPNRPLGHNLTAVGGILKSGARDYQALSGVDPSGRPADTPGRGAARGSGTANDPYVFE